MHGNENNSRPQPSGRPSVQSQAPPRGAALSQHSHSSLELGSDEGSDQQIHHVPNSDHGIPTWASRLPMSLEFRRGCRINPPGPWHVSQVLLPRFFTTTMDVGRNLVALLNSECSKNVLKFRGNFQSLLCWLDLLLCWSALLLLAATGCSTYVQPPPSIECIDTDCIVSDHGSLSLHVSHHSRSQSIVRIGLLGWC